MHCVVISIGTGTCRSQETTTKISAIIKAPDVIKIRFDKSSEVCRCDELHTYSRTFVHKWNIGQQWILTDIKSGF